MDLSERKAKDGLYSEKEDKADAAMDLLELYLSCQISA